MHAPTQPDIRTTCPYCGVGCGLLVRPDGHGGASVAGDPDHPANFGKLCSKGAALGETVGLDGRLLYPMIRQADGPLARTDWNTALDHVADGFRRVVERDGPDAVAFYVSGQLLTEDYYVANKLMKGFIGSGNIDTNSRLCMASSVAGHRRAFGADVVPGVYADLDEADLIVLVGSNAAWCHPVLFQRMVCNRRERGAKIVVIDPRRTETAEEADLVLQIAPGADTALFCGLLGHLSDTHVLDYSYIEAHTSGFGEAQARARAIARDIAATARATGLARADVARFFELFRSTRRVVTCYSQGVNQSAQGTDKVNAIINCHLATGRIGKRGTGPFSLTGQPNAMGGREVGGLANQLAAHMTFAPEDVDRVGRFWNAPRMATHEGRKAVQMFQAIGCGEIKALWVMATNPAMSLPQASAVREALGKLELFVVSDNVMSNDTINAGAHVLLPAAGWGEKDGTVTNSERRISRQRTFLGLPGETKPDWWIVTQVAQRMGFAEAFDYRVTADIFREHAALTAFENDGARALDLGGWANISDEAYEGLAPVQWPVRTAAVEAEQRFFASGGFFTPDRKARFIAPEPPVLSEQTSKEFPLRLNTGRLRDQWHSMTRTGKSPRLAVHRPEPFVEIHPDDARRAGLLDDGFAKVSTQHGAGIVRVVVSEGQRPGSLFMPIHWSAETASAARVGDLVSPQIDPFSGQPEAKATPVAIEPVALSMRGFGRTRRPVTLPSGTWWARVATQEGPEYHIATDHGPMVWHDVAHTLLGQEAEFAEELDPAKRTYCAAAFVDGNLDGYLSIGPADAPLSIETLLAALTAKAAAAQPSQPTRRVAAVTHEPMVCACYDVTVAAVRNAVASGTAANVAEIGNLLRAGTNCGSCLPELKRIVNRERAALAV
jgi:assimilatory nitrate reductase catalytic subunit